MTKVHHYVYKIEFKTGHVYYGSRSCKCLPKDDTSYLGSPRTNKVYWDENTPVKVILREFNTREEAIAHENILIQWVWSINRSISLNAGLGGIKFCTQGTKRTDEQVNKTAKPYYLVSPEGEVFEGINLTRFAKEKGLCRKHLALVLAGKVLHCHGWTSSITTYTLYKEYYENRGIVWHKGIQRWTTTTVIEGLKETKSFRLKEDALSYRKFLEDNNYSFIINPRGWKQKLEEIKNNGTSPLHEL
jgi:hypothetical protein